MSEVITARLGENVVKELFLVSKTENLDKSTVIRNMLENSILDWRKKRALKLYSEGKYSVEQAAKFAKTSLWSFFGFLKENKVPINYDIKELEKELKNIQWKQ